MKKTLLSLFIVFAAFAAQAQTVLVDFELADGHGFGFSKYHAQLTDQGILTVTESKRLDPRIVSDFDNTFETTEYEKALHPSNFRSLLWKVQTLSNAQIQVIESDVVCKLLASPAMGINHLQVLRGYDYETNTYSGELALVHGPQGCWLHRKTLLKDDGFNIRAQEVKTILRTMVLELVHQ
ncbi:MAG: hypothetical protein AAF203_03505 [Pseudomonadota bacterium]